MLAFYYRSGGSALYNAVMLERSRKGWYVTTIPAAGCPGNCCTTTSRRVTRKRRSRPPTARPARPTSSGQVLAPRQASAPRSRRAACPHPRSCLSRIAGEAEEQKGPLGRVRVPRSYNKAWPRRARSVTSTLAHSQPGASEQLRLHLLAIGPKQFATFALPARGKLIVGRGGAPASTSRWTTRRRRDAICASTSATRWRSRISERQRHPRSRSPADPGARARCFRRAIAIGALVLMVQPNRRRVDARAARCCPRRVRRPGRVGVRARRGDRRDVLGGARSRHPPSRPGAAARDVRPIDVSAATVRANTSCCCRRSPATPPARWQKRSRSTRRGGAAHAASPAIPTRRHAAPARARRRPGRDARRGGARRRRPAARSPASRRACGACRRSPSAPPPATSTC